MSKEKYKKNKKIPQNVLFDNNKSDDLLYENNYNVGRASILAKT
jgi:hypothetical protein